MCYHTITDLLLPTKDSKNCDFLVFGGTLWADCGNKLWRHVLTCAVRTYAQLEKKGNNKYTVSIDTNSLKNTGWNLKCLNSHKKRTKKERQRLWLHPRSNWFNCQQPEATKNLKNNTEPVNEVSFHHKPGVLEWLQIKWCYDVIRFAFEPEWLLSHFCPAHCKHFRTIKHLNVIPWRRDRWRRAALEMDWWKEAWDAWQQENTEK